jgi:hypothetical protein
MFIKRYMAGFFIKRSVNYVSKIRGIHKNLRNSSLELIIYYDKIQLMPMGTSNEAGGQNFKETTNVVSRRAVL